MSHPQLLAACLVAVFTTTASAGDWPCWRGPAGDGISLEPGVPQTWTSTDNIAWRTEIPGTGRSSPIVVGDRIFLTTATSEDQSRRVLALDANTGAIAWNTVVHTGQPGQMHKFNTSASSTPACDGKHIYAVFIDDERMHVVAVDLDGKLVWLKSPGTFHSSHGLAASPVLFDGGVIINGHQDGEAFIVLLDGKTGDERWRYKPEVNLRSFSTPVLTTVDNELQLIVSGATQTIALEPATGKRIWSIAGPAEKFVSTPSIGHGLVFSFGGSPDPRAMAFRLGGRGPMSEEAVVWRAERGMPYVPTPLLLGDYLHIISDKGIYTCIDPSTGKALMTARKTGPVYSSPVAVGDRIYLFEDSGACTVLANGPDFKVLARNELGEEVYTTPAIAHGSLFVRSVTSLYRISESRPVANTR